MASGVLIGDVRQQLSTLQPKSVHMGMTSPPYYLLRWYKTEPQIWGGRSDCVHAWEAEMIWKENPDRDHSGDQSLGTRGLQGAKGARGGERPLGTFCSLCDAWKGELGMEPSPHLYVDHMVEVMDAVYRVLRDDGVFFLNIGDTQAGSGKGAWKTKDVQKETYVPDPDSPQSKAPKKWDDIKEKDLIGIPWMLAFALRQPRRECQDCGVESAGHRFGKVTTARGRTLHVCPECLVPTKTKITRKGWFLRRDIIWAKGLSGKMRAGNPMPSSRTDAPISAHEYVFLLAKSKRYFYDHVAVQEALIEPKVKGPKFGGKKYPGKYLNPTYSGNEYDAGRHSGGRPRDVWFITTKPFKGAHFATFPPDLVTLCIKAGTSEGGACGSCGAPRLRKTEKIGRSKVEASSAQNERKIVSTKENLGTTSVFRDGLANREETIGFVSACFCETTETVPCLVLDPFAGSGTTWEVARALGRDFVGVELQQDYVPLIEQRIGLTNLDKPSDVETTA